VGLQQVGKLNFLCHDSERFWGPNLKTKVEDKYKKVIFVRLLESRTCRTDSYLQLIVVPSASLLETFG